MRIVFMGTPEFAVAALEALCSAGHEIVAVYTRQDTPKNRGMKMMPPPVKVCAEARNIPVYQPKGMKNEETWNELRAMAPDVIVVAAYGRILPQAVLDIPRYGCINIHASLLPAYRGASPINACILHGETESGVTIMQMNAGLDTGDMLLPVRTEILPDESFGSLHDRLAKIGGEAIVRALEMVENGTAVPVKQPEEGSYAPMIAAADCKIDFSASAFEVSCAVRAYDPAPGAFAFLGEENKMKLFAASLEDAEGSFGESGKILSVDKHGAHIACGKGKVCIGMVQGAGGKKMPADAFFRGHQALLQEIFR